MLPCSLLPSATTGVVAGTGHAAGAGSPQACDAMLLVGRRGRVVAVRPKGAEADATGAGEGGSTVPDVASLFRSLHQFSSRGVGLEPTQVRLSWSGVIVVLTACHWNDLFAGVLMRASTRFPHLCDFASSASSRLFWPLVAKSH